MKYALISYIFVFCIGVCAGAFYVSIEQAIENENPTVEYIAPIDTIEPDTLEWDLLIEALIHTESRGNDSAVGKNNDAGCLQITPIYTREANRIVGYEKFSLNDRFSRNKSIEMFNVVQRYHNPQKDVLKAIKMHNRGGGEKYVKKVMNQLNKIK